MSMFMMPHRTPEENQSVLHYADGGVTPAPGASPSAAPNPNPQTPPPIGSSPQNVADNIPAKLSEGEFVMPADVVKFYGISHFQKLITKAKEGMLSMAQDGLIKGNGPPVPNTPEPDQNAEGPAPDKPVGAAAGGFFAPPGHPMHSPSEPAYAMGGYQSYAAGGLALPALSTSIAPPVPVSPPGHMSLHLPHAMAVPGGHMSPISGRIPHNTGIVHTGIKGPIRSGTAFTHASIAAPKVHMSTGGYMGDPINAFCGDGFSAGGMPGSVMTPYSAPSAPMTAQPDPYAAQQQRSQMNGFMQPNQ